MSKGFTLIELLVALAIFALLAVMAYGGLDTVLQARSETDKAASRLNEVQKAFLWLKRDTEQTVIRPIRGEYGEQQPAFKAAEQGTYRLELTRGGYRNPAQLPRSSLQRVAYSIEDETLVRLTWPFLDRAQDASPYSNKLLSDVDSIRFRFLDLDRQWHANWPPINAQAGATEILPLALEVTLELNDWGRVTRLFLMAGQS
ncbi:MAG: type II secretion system minor pseudopilin GspJ [Thioalkalispiraceae bacterium]|jgi:general secretion pathway protein J